MKIQTHNTTDEIIEKALAMHEDGVCVSKILAEFPKDKEVLQEIFSVTSVLDKSEVHIKPPKKNLRSPNSLK